MRVSRNDTLPARVTSSDSTPSERAWSPPQPSGDTAAAKTLALKVAAAGEGRREAQNGDFLGGPTRRASDGVPLSPQRPSPGWTYRGDVLPTAYDSSQTSLRDVPPLRPSDGRPPSGPLTLYVNGIDTSPRLALDNAQTYSDLTGRPVVSLYNATSGAVSDVVESAAQMVQLRNDPAVRRLADTIYGELKAGRPVNIAAESQGALMTSNALRMVRDRLLADNGHNPWRGPLDGVLGGNNRRALEATEAQLGRVTVETYGGAAPDYPDGPRYVHYINQGDLVASAFGVPYGSRLGGRDAVYRRTNFSFHGDNPAQNAIRAHTFPEYLEHLRAGALWRPPELVRPDASGFIDDGR